MRKPFMLRYPFLVLTSSLFASLLFLAILLQPKSALADDQTRTTVSYLIGFPTDDTQDFIDDTSFVGFDLDFSMQYMESEEFGLLLGFQRFTDDRANSSYTNPSTGLTITADQERSLASLPILLKWRHYFPSEQQVKWFIGAGAGTTYVERRFFVGSFNFSEYGWQFLLRPEVGMRFELSESGSFVANLRYDYGFETDSLPTLGSLSLGLGYMVTF